MKSYSEIHNNTSEAQEIRSAVDENMIPELIQGQVGKLNELDAGIKKALDAAIKAEQQAKEAGKLSASFWSFSDQKKEAIEGLQKASIELAGAVQLEAQAQKLSFEFQTRLAEITKYLFGLGVNNIASNRIVVRELEMRLRGASEKELSELARQELMSVIQQLKEQEDLLRKQDQMKEALARHGDKIRYLLDQADTQNGRLEKLTAALSLARAHVKEATAGVVARIEDLEHTLKDQQHALASMIESTNQISTQQQRDILTLQQKILVQQGDFERLASTVAQAGTYAEQATTRLRSTLNLRIALLAIWATVVPATVYFFLR